MSNFFLCFLIIVMFVFNMAVVDVLEDFYNYPPEEMNQVKLFISLVNLTIITSCFYFIYFK